MVPVGGAGGTVVGAVKVGASIVGVGLFALIVGAGEAVAGGVLEVLTSNPASALQINC